MLNPNLISGIPVILYEKTVTGYDAFNREIVEEKPVTVENVLVQPLERTTDAQTESTNLFPEKMSFVLGIPKSDTHNWDDSRVEFWGHVFRSENGAWQGIEDLVPGPWNKKVLVRRYD